MTLRTRGLAAALAGALMLVAAACGDDSDESSGADSTGTAAAVTVTDAWARASAEMQNAGAVYLTLTGGAKADELKSASVPSSVAAKTELHETMMMPSGSGGGGTTMAGKMTMSPVSAIAVPAGKVVKLEPGGYHIMLLELAKPLASGQSFKVTLTFAGAGTVEVPVTVRAN